MTNNMTLIKTDAKPSSEFTGRKPDAPTREVGPKTLFETPNYKVFIGQIPDLKDTPAALSVKYVVQHKTDGVIYALAASIAQATLAALGAEAERIQAIGIAAAQEERGWALPTDETQQPITLKGAPRLDG